MRSVRGAVQSLISVLGSRRALITPFIIMLLGLAALSSARADDVSADVTGYTDNGYGRVLLTFSKEIKTNVRVQNGIVVVDFGQPVKVAVDKLAARLPGYVQLVRRDPDGSAIRLALSRKVTVNVMQAAEKVFVDLLPENWVGLPPSLPTEVTDELARRALAAEQQARMERSGPRKVWQPVKMRYAMAPTFSRFSFEMTEPVKVLSKREGQELRITFDAPVKVDFGEALAQLPATVVGLDADYETDSTTVKLVMAPDAELRTFQENAAFIADVMPGAPQTPNDIEAAVKAMQGTPKAEEAPSVPVAKDVEVLTPPSAAQATPAKPSTAPGVVPAAPAPRADNVVPSVQVAEPAMQEAKKQEVKKEEAAKPAPQRKVLTGPVVASITRQTGGISISLPFDEPVAGAVFRRGNSTYIVLDSTRQVRLTELANDPTQIVKSFTQKPLKGGQLIKLKIDASRLVSLSSDDKGWTLQAGGMIANPSRPIPARRVFAGENHAGIFVPLASPDRAFDLKDPEIGDNLVVITASSPVRGLVRGQEFVDFDALASIHGVVLSPKSDHLSVELTLEGVTITRPDGLRVSEMEGVLPPLPDTAKGPSNVVAALDPTIWQEEGKDNYIEREMELARLLSEAPIASRAEKRLALARFYLARGLASNAIGVLDAGTDEEKKFGSDSSYALLHGAAELEMARPSVALTDLKNPVLVKSPQAALLRSSALSELTHWSDARDQFNSGKNAIASLPVELQRKVLVDSMRAMISAGDYATATDIRGELDLVGIPAEMKSSVMLLSARLAAGLGRGDQAINDYAELAAGPESPAMAEARLRLVEMRMNSGDFDRMNAIKALETLSFVWRGDETEVETMRLLAKLYVAEARYREAFNLLDAALLVKPESNTTRSFYNEMSSIFEDLFLSDRANSIEPVEALSLYYDFSKLTPIGRRGDELIRRLSDRLVSVDLLDQAAELLDYQVKYRLTGVAKAQVATKLAWVQLLNSKPAAAVQALASTRMADLPQELREQRLMLEARGLSELGRYNAALELASGTSGTEGERLRGDILWTAKRWREAGETYEKLIGERWQKPQPLNETERNDVLRAAIAYTFANETVGLARLRDRYAAKMPESNERAALGLMTAGGGNSTKKIGDVAKALSTVDSLKQFLKLYQVRFPDRPLPAEAASGPQKVSSK